MKHYLMILLSLVAACGAEDTPGRSVEGMLSVTTSNAGTRSWSLTSGWNVELEEAVVLLGPVYLRPPKRASTPLSALFVSKAHAHAQTLTDGEVMGEYLGQITYDVLGTELYADALTSEAGPVDRLSIALDPPRGPDAQARAHGYLAFMRGQATRSGERVTFSCGLRVDSMANEAPKNVEARRRVDNVKVAAAVPMDDGTHVRIRVHPERWFDFVRFEEFVGSDNPCAQEGSALALQWYLGLRRPEAFSAEMN